MTDTLIFKNDRFNGILINSKDHKHLNVQEFEEKLTASLETWKANSKKGIWIKILIEQSHFIPVCVKHEFVFHHAKPEYVMMNQWLPEGYNHLPEYANQYHGVGGFVINDRNELLVVKEKFSISEAKWHLPGGQANAGEDLGETAIREVKEETGIDCEFVSLLSLRQQHDYRYGCSDTYYVCLLRPLTSDIMKCELEIADCRWMPFDEYLNDDLCVSDENRYIARLYKDYLETGLSINPIEIQNYNKTGRNLLYSASKNSLNNSTNSAAGDRSNDYLFSCQFQS
ncbi:uncharacterized protein LOC141898812 [Tubulanus polymorphus]|uniref:uncharacterized protein LOC141898812 n=1 Tax=Tubulanus polymorphus TaxID=672921 RepID=UPI003DA33560